MDKIEVSASVKFLTWWLVFNGILWVARSLRIYPGIASELLDMLPFIGGKTSILGFFAYVITVVSCEMREGVLLDRFPYASYFAMLLNGLSLFFIAFGLSRMRKWAFYTVTIFVIFDVVISILFRRPLNFIIFLLILFPLYKKRNLFT